MEEMVLNSMRRGAITCSEDTSIREVAQIMISNRIRYCVILDKKHELTGIISARSIMKAFGMDIEITEAKDIMLPYTITINPHSPLKEAIEFMLKKHIEHLIVVSNRPGKKTVYGILSAADIVRRMARS